MRLKTVDVIESEVIYFFTLQMMEWPVARGINGDEKIDISILIYNRSL